MTNIDASLRRPILPQTSGGTVPDSQALLEDNPQLIMDPGVARPVYKFDDGGGLTDAFGNVYDGYGGAGGSSFVNTPAESIDDQVDVANDLDIIKYNAATEFYESKSREDAGLAVVSTTDTPNDLDLLQYSAADNEYEPRTFDEMGIAKFGGGPPTDGQIPY